MQARACSVLQLVGVHLEIAVPEALVPQKPQPGNVQDLCAAQADGNGSN